MNSDVLAAIFTLLLIASKIGLASRGDPVHGETYIIYGGGTYLFWLSMRSIADAMTGKNYIRGSGEAKVYREETPGRYWLMFIGSAVLSAYCAGVLFDFFTFY